jgi:raffinose/stachyose/melibiose transport system substrate-binding protein
MKSVYRFVTTLFCLAMLVCGYGRIAAAPNPPAPSTSATDKGSHKPVTITIMHEHSADAAQRIVSSAGFVAMLDKFKAEHPWVTLEETIVPLAEFNTKFLAAAAANELPDVCYVKYGWLRNLAGNNLVADITNYVDPSLYLDRLYSTTYKGRIYGLPNKYSIYNTVLYNEDVWKKAGYNSFPTTMDELIKAQKYFASKGMDVIALGNKGKWFGVAFFIAPLAYEYCGQDWVNSIVAHDGKAKWTDPRFVKALSKLKEMSVLFNKDCNIQNDIWAMGWYLQGKAAAHVVGGWGIDTAKGMSKDYPETWKNTRVALLPTVSGKPGVLSSAVGAGIGVNSKLTGDKFEAALALVKQISSKDYAQFVAARGATSPVKIDINFDSMGQPYRDFAAIIKSHTSGVNVEDYVDQSVVSVLEVAVQNILAGDATPEQAAASLQAAEDLLEAKK